MSSLFPSSDIGLFGRRQRHARGHRVPVRIAADAGAAPSDRNTTIIVDDFGTDEALLPEIGCQCCTVRVKLQEALRQRLSERERKPLSRIVIETRQDIAPILRTFATERALGAELYLEEAPPLVGNSFTLTEQTPLSWDAFSRFMANLIAMRGRDLTRVKGLLNIEGCRGPVVVHCMQHLSLPPVELQAWPEDEKSSRIEFVTRGIEAPTVRALFDSVRAMA